MSSRRRLPKRGSLESNYTPETNPFKTRGFANGIQARESKLPKTDLLQTRPFAPLQKKSSVPKEIPDIQAEIEKGELFGYKAANIPVFGPAIPPESMIQSKPNISEDNYDENGGVKELNQNAIRQNTVQMSTLEETHLAEENGESEIVQRDIDPAQVASGKTPINKQDIDLEQVGHGMVYHDQLAESEVKWLQEKGYQGKWFPDGNIVDAGSGLHYGLLLPTPEGKAAGIDPILAFRGTSDLGTLWQDLDINSPGHGGIQQILKGFPVAYLQGIVSEYGRLAVTGHSLGGALAQHFTGTHPNLVKRLVTFQSAAPNAAQYKENMDALKPEDKPEVVHHIAKGDIVDLAGGEHLEGTFFEHDLEASGMASVSTLARIKQAHTSKLLNTEDVVGANQTLANGEEAQGTHQQAIKEYHGSRPYGVKSRLAEFGRMTALNKVTALPGGLIAGLAGLGLTIPEVIVRGTAKGVVAGGKAIGNAASSLVNSARNFFGRNQKKKE